MERTTVRCLAMASLEKAEWGWPSWVRILPNNMLQTHISIWKPRGLDHYHKMKMLKCERYIPQCLRLHPCVGFHPQWGQAALPSCPATTPLALLHPHTSGTKMASFCQMNLTRLMASRMPPTSWMPWMATWSVTSWFYIMDCGSGVFMTFNVKTALCLFRSIPKHPRETRVSITARLSMMLGLLSAAEPWGWKSVSAFSLCHNHALVCLYIFNRG